MVKQLSWCTLFNMDMCLSHQLLEHAKKNKHTLILVITAGCECCLPAGRCVWPPLSKQRHGSGGFTLQTGVTWQKESFCSPAAAQGHQKEGYWNFKRVIRDIMIVLSLFLIYNLFILSKRIKFCFVWSISIMCIHRSTGSSIHPRKVYSTVSSNLVLGDKECAQKGNFTQGFFF